MKEDTTTYTVLNDDTCATLTPKVIDEAIRGLISEEPVDTYPHKIQCGSIERLCEALGAVRNKAGNAEQEREETLKDKLKDATGK